MEKQQIDLSSLQPHTSIVSSNIFSYIYLLLHRANKQKFSLTLLGPEVNIEMFWLAWDSGYLTPRLSDLLVLRFRCNAMPSAPNRYAIWWDSHRWSILASAIYKLVALCVLYNRNHNLNNQQILCRPLRTASSLRYQNLGLFAILDSHPRIPSISNQYLLWAEMRQDYRPPPSYTHGWSANSNGTSRHHQDTAGKFTITVRHHDRSWCTR